MVGFHSIPTIVGYLMLNPLYIKDIWFDLIWIYGYQPLYAI